MCFADALRADDHSNSVKWAGFADERAKLRFPFPQGLGLWGWETGLLLVAQPRFGGGREFCSDRRRRLTRCPPSHSWPIVDQSSCAEPDQGSPEGPWEAGPRHKNGLHPSPRASVEEMHQRMVRCGKGSPGPWSADPGEDGVTTPLPPAATPSLGLCPMSFTVTN